MRVLLDACVYGRAVDALRSAGHDAAWAGDWPEDPGDEAILARAAAERRVLVTLDSWPLPGCCGNFFRAMIRAAVFRGCHRHVMSTISFSIPDDLADSLAKLGPDISRTAKEALLVDLYRRRAITLRTVREVLGLGRLEVDAVLARHQVEHDLSVDEFAAQAEALRKRLQ